MLPLSWFGPRPCLPQSREFDLRSAHHDRSPHAAAAPAAPAGPLLQPVLSPAVPTATVTTAQAQALPSIEDRSWKFLLHGLSGTHRRRHTGPHQALDARTRVGTMTWTTSRWTFHSTTSSPDPTTAPPRHRCTTTLTSRYSPFCPTPTFTVPHASTVPQSRPHPMVGADRQPWRLLLRGRALPFSGSRKPHHTPSSAFLNNCTSSTPSLRQLSEWIPIISQAGGAHKDMFDQALPLPTV